MNTTDFLVLLFLQAFSISYSTQRSTQYGCNLDISNNTNGAHMPVIADLKTKNLKLIIPSKGLIKLKRGETVIFACPGAKNYLEDVEAGAITSTCEGKNELKVGNRFMEFEDIKCKKNVHATVTNPHKRCGEKGNLLVIGYRFEEINQYLPLINVCYNEAKGIAFYTEHFLHGEEIKYAAKSTSRPAFSTEGLPPKILASTAYNKNFQKSTFNSLMESSLAAEKFVNIDSYLAIGHLSPYADFIYSNSQRSSNFYINACPQWQVINNGNWKSVELLVRRTAGAYKKTFHIITGTHDILKLPNGDNNLVEISLQRGKLPVPKYFWKIMYDIKEKNAIAFVVLNNPFAKIYDKPEFCKNICNIYDWGKSQWQNFTKGYVFCCDVKELRKIIGSVPDIQVNGILHGDN